MKSNELYDKFKQNLYYVIIFSMSILSMTIIPMLGSNANLNWNLPNTVAGWIVYIMAKVIVGVINMLIYYCFMQQGLLNSKSDKRYQEAIEILAATTNKKEYKPRSPKEWKTIQYLHKGTTIFACSVLSAVSLTQAILTFDILVFLALLFTLSLGIVFGLLQMKHAEEYWQVEFYQYAKLVQSELNKKEMTENDHTK